MGKFLTGRPLDKRKGNSVIPVLITTSPGDQTSPKLIYEGHWRDLKFQRGRVESMTERFVYVSVGSSSGTDQTASSGGSGSWLNSSAARLRRLSSPTANAFLTPAFNACAANPKSTGSPDVDPSLLRYTRSRLPLSTTSSSSASNSPDPHSTARKRLHRLLYLRSSLSSLSSPSPLSPIENLPAAPARSPTLYKTPVKVEMEEDVLVMDGVLVSDSESGRPRSSISEFGSTGSPSSSSSANYGGGSSLYKTEICRSWEELGFCRYGYKCQVGCSLVLSLE